MGSIITEDRFSALVETGKPARREDGGEYGAGLLEMVLARQWLATPTAKANQLAPPMMKWPGCRAWLPAPTATPYGSNTGGSAGRAGRERPSLNQMARRGLWPTPVMSGHRSRRQSENWQGSDLVSRVTAAEEAAGNQQKKSGGKLNPNWVAWLMGWPIGWTDLKPLEMDKFRQWLRSHGASLEGPDAD
jgi:hypothetical protein